MRPEDRDLIMKDLCGRLLYLENWVQYEGKDYIITGYGHGRVSLLSSPFSSSTGPCPLIEDIKPYLRPMSSMTEEEYKEYDKACELDCSISANVLKTNIKARRRVLISTWYNGTDWLNAHHFDYRGLIEKGLALEAPEGMYKTE